MEWLRQCYVRFKEAIGVSSEENKVTDEQSNQICQGIYQSTNRQANNTLVVERQQPLSIFSFLGVRMKPKKEFKGSKLVAKQEEILKIRKTRNRSFKSPVVRPVRGKNKSTWMQRLLSSNISSSSSEPAQDLNYFQAGSGRESSKEPARKTYSSQFMNSQHFNFVGHDKHLGPLVLSIKYPATMKKVPQETLLLLRLPTGLVRRTWNQFQLSNPAAKPPLELARMSFPSLALTCELLPILSPVVGQTIAEYDEDCDDSDHAGDGVDSKRTGKLECDSGTFKLKELQGKLITSTLKFLEVSDWDFELYENFLTEKKSSFSKYLSFTLPVPLLLKTPKSASRIKNKSKSPKFMSLPKKMLEFGDAYDSQPPAMKMKYLFADDIATEETEVGSMCQLTSQVSKLTTTNDLHLPEESEEALFTFENDDKDLKLKIVSLELEKERILESSELLKKETEELRKNERRLVRELSTAHTIIEDLKKRLL